MDRKVISRDKLSDRKCKRMKATKSFVSTTSDEATEAQHLLAEPKAEHLLDDFLYFDGLDFSTTQGQDGLGLEVLDGLLDDIDEVDDIDAANDISGACKDFLLDVELAKVCDLDSIPYKGSHFGNSSSESQSPQFSGSSGHVLGLSESSAGTVLEVGIKNEGKVLLETHDLEKGDKLECPAPNAKILVSATHNLENLSELDDAKPMEAARSSCRSRKKSVHVDPDGASLRKRQSHKPTKRYIDEFSDPANHSMERPCSSKDREWKIRSQNDAYALEGSFRETIAEVESTDTGDVFDLKLKHLIKRHTNPLNGSKDKCVKLKSENQYNIKALTSDSKDASLGEATSHEACEDIGELSKSKIKRIIVRCKLSSDSSRNKSFRTSSQEEVHLKAGPKSAARDEPSESQRRRGRPKKSASFLALEFENRYTASESEDEGVKRRRSKKRNDRRKCQRMWTLEEATKLIDGIAQCGAGRWTAIKRLHFSSSSHRTTIDLRDKWRNLLRASHAVKQKRNKKEEGENEERQKHSGRTLPMSLLDRVRELASMHPYPRYSPGGKYRNRKD